LVVGGNIQTPHPKSKATKYSGFVKSIDVKKRKVMKEYRGPTGSVKSVRFSRDQKFLASGGFDNTVRLFDVKTGELINTFEEPLRVEAVAFTPDSQFLLSGGHQKKISFYRLSDMELVYELPSPRTEYLDFSRDGRLLLTSHEDSGLLSLYMMISNVHRVPGLYQKIQDQLLNNRDIKK
jgi:WD40 repeat protein